MVASAYNRARWLAIAMLGGLFAQAVVVEVFWWFSAPFSGFAGAEPGMSPLVRYVLVGAGLADLVFLPFLRRILLAVRGDRRPAALISRLMAVTVITLAISSFPAVMGLLIFLLFGGRLVFYALWLVSLVLLSAYFPRQSFWEEWVEGGGRMEV